MPTTRVFVSILQTWAVLHSNFQSIRYIQRHRGPAVGIEIRSDQSTRPLCTFLGGGMGRCSSSLLWGTVLALAASIRSKKDPPA